MLKFHTMEKMISKETLNLHQPVVVGVSGPSGAGKDYLINTSSNEFINLGVQTTTVQMTTERPDRGSGVETKICISSDEYSQVENSNQLIGSHQNGDYRYGYKMIDLQKGLEQCKNGGIVFIELNPFAQGSFPEELKAKLGVNMLAWIGVQNTIEQTETSMRERGESEDSIKERIAKVKKYYDAMNENPFISYVNNGPDNRQGSTADFTKIIKDKILETL